MQATPAELAYFIRLFGGTLGGNGGVAGLTNAQLNALGSSTLGFLRAQTTRRLTGPILTISSSKGRSTEREPVRRLRRRLHLRRRLRHRRRLHPRPMGVSE